MSRRISREAEGDGRDRPAGSQMIADEMGVAREQELVQ